MHAASTQGSNEQQPSASKQFRDPLRGWYDAAWVRNTRIDYSIPETITEPVLFSPHLVPVLGHPLILERGFSFARELLAHRFYIYADFTSVLERDAVNIVTNDISRKRFWTELPGQMYEGAWKIYVDEGFHALESDQILKVMAQDTSIAPDYLHTPRFMTNLELLCSNLDPAKRRLALAGFAIVSETLISAILADIPRDPLVVPSVRRFVLEHARDEGRHHAYFAELLKYSWCRLPQAGREFLGPLFAKFVRWFLEPDLHWLSRFLRDRKFTAKQVDDILAEMYPQVMIDSQVRTSAIHSIARFREAGVFESARTLEGFAAARLL